MSRDPDACVVFYSRTGTTERVARDLADRLREPAVERIRPRRERSYYNWLARSFVPGSTVAVEPVDVDPREHDAVLLGTPKWTLSCPPVTAYLESAPLAGARVAPFVTYGGFDGARYTRALAARLRARGAEVPATLRVKRDRVGGAGYAAGLDRFCRLAADG